ncbi:MAG: ATP-binding protein [Desulfurobacteriaceae bacterium]
MYKKAFLALIFFSGFLAIGYFGVGILSQWAGEFYLNNPFFHLLFVLILLILTVLFALFVRNLVLFFFPHFKTKLRIKIFTAFLLLILGPALFSIFFASGIINQGLDRLLRIQVKRIVDISHSTTENFLNFIYKDLERKAVQLSARKNVYPYTLKAYGIDGYARLSKKEFYRSGNFPLEKKEVERIARKEKHAFLDEETKQLVFCKRVSDKTVCVSKRLPDKLYSQVVKVEKLHSNYQTLVAYKTPIKTLYTFSFGIMGLAVLFGALWFARYFERRISVPIEALHSATKRISEGDLNVRIEEEGTDELKHVIDGFNHMVSQLKALKKNLEESRRYLEEVLNSISPAIITINYSGKIISCNKSARRLLGFLGEHRGEDIRDLLQPYPELKRAVEKLLSGKVSSIEVREEIGGREKFLTVELVSPPDIEDRILIVEDVTNLVRAKKSEAWREVAQRIAHEIKNPLTPITLNAERIRRQLKRKNPNLEEVIDRAVESILQEVEVIKRLIEEFRKFARLPLPEKRMSNLNKLIKDTLEPYENRIEIRYKFEDLPEVPVDRNLMREVFINLVENSIEAGATEVEVSTTTKDGKAFIVFRDNGPGIPEEVMEKLFAPYVSTKEEGWGLGLSIVKKIVEDHGGKIYTVDPNTFVVELPI